ncbi:hypothetical protein J6590_070306 [Homalodisca vitripennis]|nr:hypothetical protein J6590_070306 [Homalodisca vitripennis]
MLLTVLFATGDGGLAGARVTSVHADQAGLTLIVSLAELSHPQTIHEHAVSYVCLNRITEYYRAVYKLYCLRLEVAGLQERESPVCMQTRPVSHSLSLWQNSPIRRPYTNTQCPIAGETPVDMRLVLHSCGDTNSGSCGCRVLQRVNQYKYLGVIMGSKLK